MEPSRQNALPHGGPEEGFTEYQRFVFPAQDERHARSSEFIQVFRGAWANKEVSFRGRYY